jgi:hypothetical protein
MSDCHKGSWYGVDLDGTLAEYDYWRGIEHIGAPVPAMVERVKKWIADGQEVRIFTARVGGHLTATEVNNIQETIQAWCIRHIGSAIPITATKDLKMYELWDDRAVCVERNTGRILGRNP